MRLVYNEHFSFQWHLKWWQWKWKNIVFKERKQPQFQLPGILRWETSKTLTSSQSITLFKKLSEAQCSPFNTAAWMSPECPCGKTLDSRLLLQWWNIYEYRDPGMVWSQITVLIGRTVSMIASSFLSIRFSVLLHTLLS